MQYIIQMTCINEKPSLNLRKYDVVYLDNVFGREKFTRDKSSAYKFLSLERVNSLCHKIESNGNFKTSIIKTY